MPILSRRAFVAGCGAVGAWVALGSACSPTPSSPPPAATSTPNVSAAAPAGNTYTPTALNPRVQVKVTDDQLTSMVAIYLAYDRGYFAAEGLDIDLQVSSDRSQDVQLLATSKAQFIVTLPDPVLFNAIARKVDVKILASATVNGPTDRPAAFLVRKDLVDGGQVKGPSDLRGLTVAVGAPSSLFYVDTYLKRGGLTVDDVKIANLQGPEAIAALQTKAIDAAWEGEPIATSMNAQGLATSVAITGELVPGSVAGALAVSPQFARDQPEATQHFVTGFLRGARDYYTGFMQSQSDRGPIIQTLVNHTTVKDASLYSKLGLPSYNPNCSTDPTPSWQVFQDFYVKRGLQERPVDTSAYVDFSYLNRSLDLLGRVQT